MKVMHHAHDLYLRVISKVLSFDVTATKQCDIAEGKTYYNKKWGLAEKIKLIKHLSLFRKSIVNGETEKLKSSVNTFPCKN